MTPPDRSPASRDDAIERTAAAWIARREGGLRPDEQEALAQWRAADPQHDAAFRRLESAQQLLARLPETPAAAALLAELDALTRPRARVLRFPRVGKFALIGAAAAALALALWWPRERPAAPTSTYATAAGQHRSLDLSDGSTLVLGGDSAIDVAFVPAERRIHLQKGEAHFYVAKDPARPFLVSAGLVTVRAVGTAFNVRRSDGAVEVLVTEGKVQVDRNVADAAEPLFLVAGQRAVVDTTAWTQFAGDSRSPIAAEADVVPAWSAPRLAFNHTPLADAVARFNRYNRVQIEIADTELGQRVVGGSFDADNADAFVNLLAAAGDIRVEHVSDTRVVLHKIR